MLGKFETNLKMYIEAAEYLEQVRMYFAEITGEF